MQPWLPVGEVDVTRNSENATVCCGSLQGCQRHPSRSQHGSPTGIARLVNVQPDVERALPFMVRRIRCLRESTAVEVGLAGHNVGLQMTEPERPVRRRMACLVEMFTSM